MDSQKLNYYISITAIPLGFLLIFYWRDLGFTLMAIGIINYVLYRKDINWTII